MQSSYQEYLGETSLSDDPDFESMSPTSPQQSLQVDIDNDIEHIIPLLSNVCAAHGSLSEQTDMSVYESEQLSSIHLYEGATLVDGCPC